MGAIKDLARLGKNASEDNFEISWVMITIVVILGFFLSLIILNQVLNFMIRRKNKNESKENHN